MYDKGRLWVAMFWSAEPTHILELLLIFDALRCVPAADQNMAAYNHPLMYVQNISSYDG